MSKQLLFVNTDGIAVSYAEARAGKLGFVEEGAIVGALTGAEAQIMAGSFTTTPFTGDEVVRAVKVSPSTGVAQVVAVDLSNASSDDPLYVKLINTTIGTMDVEIRSFEADTAALITAAINAAGADTASPFYGFTASLTDSTVTVTAPINSTFRAAATDGSSISYSVTPEPSVGQEDDMIELEEYCLPWKGVTNKVGHPVIKPASEVVSGATYIQYIFDIKRGVANKAGTGTLTAEDIQIILAVKSDLTTTIAALDGDAVAEE